MAVKTFQKFNGLKAIVNYLVDGETESVDGIITLTEDFIIVENENGKGKAVIRPEDIKSPTLKFLLRLNS